MYRGILNTIVLHEIAAYFRSAKFLCGFIFIMLSVMTAVTINLNDYCARLDEYSQNPFSSVESTRVTVSKPPHVLSIFAPGREARLGMMAQLSDSYIPLKTTGGLDRLGLRDLVLFGIIPVDCVFAIRILFSLFVVFFAFDIVSGEKVSGTLRLIFSNGIPRHVLITGKTIAGALVIFSLVLVSFGLSFIIAVVNPKVVFTSAEIARLAAMAGAAFLYLMFFYCVSIAVSTLADTPAASLHTLMFFWVVLVIVLPNLVPFIEDPSRLVPSDETLGLRRYQAVQEVDKEKTLEYERMNGWAEGVYRIEHDVYLQSMNVARRARALSSISPAVMFDEATVRMACTGFEDHERFLARMREYWDDSIRFRNTNPANYNLSEYDHDQKILNLPPTGIVPNRLRNRLWDRCSRWRHWPFSRSRYSHPRFSDS